jgi:hypothetical protein
MSDELDTVGRFVWEQLTRKVERAGYLEQARALRDHVDIAPVQEPEPRPAGPGLTLRRYEVRRRVGELTVELNAVDASLLSWLCPTLREPATDELDPAEAFKVAERAAVPPPGAILEHAGYEEVGGVPVYIATWAHEEGSLRVERDYLRVLVNGHTGLPFGVSRRWHSVDLNRTVR